MRPASEPQVKKPYEQPKLTIYGDLMQITLAKAKGKGNPDGVKKKRT